jgi:hypothetical protein
MKKLIVETRTQKLYWDEENEIVWGELFESIQTLEDAIENVDAQEKLRDSINREKTRVLIKLDALFKISKEARNYFSNERTASIQRATALLTSSKITVLIANFFMGLNKPKSPTKMFNNSEEAIRWLQKFPKE